MQRTCVSCDNGAIMTRFEDETVTIDHAGMKTVVKGLSGGRCPDCPEMEFDPDSAHRYAEAGEALVLSAREHQARDIRRIRRKLGLSQAAAAPLTGGGHNAFSRYERGEVTPLPAVVNLVRILDQHPELLKELG